MRSSAGEVELNINNVVHQKYYLFFAGHCSSVIPELVLSGDAGTSQDSSVSHQENR